MQKEGKSEMNDLQRVIVIDDEEIVLLSVARTLEREGYVVDKAFSAREALEMLEQGTYDLVITDLMMPEVNGIELLGILKEKHVSTPAIMITGYPTIKTAIEALRLGAVDYVPKPFTRQELLSPVSRALSGLNGETDHSRNSGIISWLPSDMGKPINVGDEFVLPNHSWVRCEEDGTVMIGVEESFLLNVGISEIVEVVLPQINEQLEQGHSNLKVRTRQGKDHSAYMPISGRVVDTNKSASDEIIHGNLSAWVVRIEPVKLLEETELLKRRKT